MTTTKCCCETTKKPHKKEQCNEFVAEREKLEIRIETIERELENARNELKQVLKDQHETQRPISKEEKQEIPRHHYWSLKPKELKSFIQKMSTEVEAIKAEHYKQMLYENENLKNIVKQHTKLCEDVARYMENLSQILVQDTNLKHSKRISGHEYFEQQCLKEMRITRSLMQQIFKKNEREDEADRNTGLSVEQDASSLSDLTPGAAVPQCSCIAKYLRSMEHSRGYPL